MSNTDKLTLYRGAPPTPNFVWSPFVNKLEARLRFAQIPYRTAEGSPKTAPRGKIPYIERSGEILGDTTLIINHLTDCSLLPPLNENLTPAQAARDLALRALLEDKVYFYSLRERWWDNYYTMREGVLAPVPWPLRVLVGLLAYRTISATLVGQGTGRYDAGEVAALKHEAWRALEDLLQETRTSGGEPFWVLGGKEPTEADATVFGFIASALVCDAAPATKAIVRALPVTVEYAERIREKYYPEYDKWEALKEED